MSECLRPRQDRAEKASETETLKKCPGDREQSGGLQHWHVLTFQDDSDGVGSESLSSRTQCLVLGCNTDQPKHISTHQQHADKPQQSHMFYDCR